MTHPTAEEIRTAHESVESADGPLGASSSMEMAQLVLRDPMLRGIADRMAGGRPMTDGRLSHVLAVAMAVGLNYGLHIGEARAAAQPAPDTPETAAEKARGAADWGAKFEALGRREP